MKWKQNLEKKKAKNDLEKDFFKLIKNEIFGKQTWKIWENIELVSLQKPKQGGISYYQNQTNRQQFFFSENLLAKEIKNHKSNWISQSI